MAFVRACALGELDPETALAVEVDGHDVALVRSGGRVYAIADECSHAAIPLSEGDVEDGEIECYLHGSRFDLATGHPLGLPATEPVAVYPCQVQGEDILVDVAAPLDSDRPSPRNPTVQNAPAQNDAAQNNAAQNNAAPNNAAHNTPALAQEN